MQQLQNSFSQGVKDGIPIGLGYLSVAFTFGMMAVSRGMPFWSALVISASNVTSAGQFAGLTLIFSGGSYFEMALTQFIINIRYALMSLSISQKMHSSVTVLDRLLFAFCNTDEVFAVASAKDGELCRRYLFGLILMPYAGWTLGTLIGGAAGSLLPDVVRSALGIAIYGMFIAIVIPPAKKNKSVLIVVSIAVALSCALRYLPALRGISSGFAIIICALVASAVGAYFFPIADKKEGKC